MADVREVVIDRVGSQGDGVVLRDHAADGVDPAFVPFTLAGERVAVTVEDRRMSLERIITASPDRIAPVCRHFGECGGCALQHMAPPAYLEWKHAQTRAAFTARGIECAIDPVRPAAGRRRRAIFSAEHEQYRVKLGFHAAHSHDLIDIGECPVLDQRIVAAMPGIRQLIGPLLPKRDNVRVGVTMMSSGLDIAIEGIKKTLSPDVRTEFARTAGALRVARVSVNGDVVFEALPASLTFGSAEVVIPPGVFIQAVHEAELAMTARIVAAVGTAKSVADLFCGVGAFTFPLAIRAKVTAYDSDQRALSALQAAVKRTSGIKPIVAHVRDLFREPLSTLELNAFDAIVFDPPRAGAEAQAQRIAKSTVKTVVAVSCNPATLARDARHLIDGGYVLQRVTPIDQFEYSPHIEAVAVFLREKPNR